MEAIYATRWRAQLRPETRYDSVVEALGDDGELVRRPALVNVLTDRAVAYPRRSKLA